MDPKPDEIKTACPACGGHIVYQTELIGWLVNCPHCQHEMILPCSRGCKSAPSNSFLSDPNWPARIKSPPGRVIAKGIAGAIELIVFGFSCALVLILFVVAIRLLHAAWGR